MGRIENGRAGLLAAAAGGGAGGLWAWLDPGSGGTRPLVSACLLLACLAAVPAGRRALRRALRATRATLGGIPWGRVWAATWIPFACMVVYAAAAYSPENIAQGSHGIPRGPGWLWWGIGGPWLAAGTAATTGWVRRAREGARAERGRQAAAEGARLRAEAGKAALRDAARATTRAARADTLAPYLGHEAGITLHGEGEEWATFGAHGYRYALVWTGPDLWQLRWGPPGEDAPRHAGMPVAGAGLREEIRATLALHADGLAAEEDRRAGLVLAALSRRAGWAREHLDLRIRGEGPCWATFRRDGVAYRIARGPGDGWLVGRDEGRDTGRPPGRGKGDDRDLWAAMERAQRAREHGGD